MDARAIARKAADWIFRGTALREARAGLRDAGGGTGAAAARQAKLLLEVARRVAEPGEALPAGAHGAVVLGLTRDAITWALAARHPGGGAPPAELRALWDASAPNVMAGSPPDNAESAALRKTLLDDYDPRALTVDDTDVARVRAFAEALIWNLDAPRRRVQGVLI